MDSPKVSIITVSYNSAATIEQTVRSVLDQDYGNIEYLVVDGGSKDGTQDIVSRYRDHIAHFVSEPDQGIYDAMNKGIRASTGEIVGILNSDDFYSSPRSLSRLVERMLEAGSDTVFADMVMVDPSNTGRIVRYYRSGHFRPAKLRYGWMPAHPTMLVRKALYDRHGVFRTDYRIAADFEMVTRLYHGAGASYAHLPEVVITMREGGVSTRSLRNRWLLNREIVRACSDNGLRTSMGRVLLKVPAKLMEYVRRPEAMPR